MLLWSALRIVGELMMHLVWAMGNASTVKRAVSRTDVVVEDRASADAPDW